MSQRRRGPAPAANESGPHENATARKLLDQQRSAVVRPLPLSWARALIDAGGPDVPEYRSHEWMALPDDSRAKVAATVIAAERDYARRVGVEVVQPSSHRARRIAEARRSRPGDHPGGAVPLWDFNGEVAQ
ncbi:hypothetical protein [Geodermatophilus sp. SYSU D01036]